MKQTGEKKNKTLSFDYYFCVWLENKSMQRGIPMSTILQEAAEAKYPEISQQKTKIIRRVV